MAARGAVDGLGAGPQRPNGGRKWSEVKGDVQQPDGSVRISPPFKSGSTATVGAGSGTAAAAGNAAAAASATTASPSKPRAPASTHSLGGLRRLAGGPVSGLGALGVPAAGGGSSRGGSSRGTGSSRGGSSRGAGSSGKSSRSSSRDIARDGDISSRCSSGCWETSTHFACA
eukprot:TRINITY_DN27919_c0_g1_i1.p2 TRINITY_DN27919_c0_g1~~TRINITY_DN27919_c0_g1_i1.p2  ORF type:complete len:172 (-),score=35.31 TRINITY_DN27919_c0_g1_i1:384-899(-)